MNRQQELEGVSDFEINELVRKLSGAVLILCPTIDEDVQCIDYCSNPSDIMPIAFENEISLIKFDNEMYEAIAGFDICPMNGGVVNVENSSHKNPLRAICIVFILMTEGKGSNI